MRTQLYRIIGVDLTAIDGLNSVAVQTFISHTGVTLSAWPTSNHLVSWLSLCPNNDISGGKIIYSWMKRSKNAAAQALRVAAMSLANSKSALGAFYRRMRAKHGPQTAITATAAKLARIIYAMVTKREEYRDLGADYYEQKYKDRHLKIIKRRAASLGFKLVPHEKQKEKNIDQ